MYENFFFFCNLFIFQQYNAVLWIHYLQSLNLYKKMLQYLQYITYSNLLTNTRYSTYNILLTIAFTLYCKRTRMMIIIVML